MRVALMKDGKHVANANLESVYGKLMQFKDAN